MRKTERYNTLKSALITLGIAVLIGISVMSAFWVSENHEKLFDYPAQNGAVKDMNGFTASGKRSAYMTGDWEFFYNKWIVTDNLTDASPDFIIDVPKERWTGKEVNGEKLKKTGYASYRIYLTEVEAGTRITLSTNCHIPYRFFVNGNLNSQRGELSKTETNMGGSSKSYAYITTSDEPIEIVLELSYNSEGGFYKKPTVSFGGPYGKSGGTTFISFVVFLVVGMMIAFIVFSLVLGFGIYVKERFFTFSALILSIFAHHLTSEELIWQFRVLAGKDVLGGLYHFWFATGALMMFVFLLNILSVNVIKIKKSFKITIFAVIAASVALFYALSGTEFQIFAVILLVLPFCYVFYELSRSMLKKEPFSILYFGILFWLTALFILEAIDVMGIIVYSFYPGVSLVLAVNMAAVSFLMYVKIRSNAHDALKAARLEKEISDVKTLALRSQIKPHFVFNSLTSIQDMYHRSIEEGDEALARFSKHLRLNVESDDKELIPFEKELVNIDNYFMLENLRRDNKLNLFLNVNYVDFSVPILSLQPLVENAVKYGELDKRKNGYISIESELNGDGVILTVSDNGAGFDVSKIKESSKGLKNVAERFKYVMGASMTVDSKTDEGTKITIIIPHTTQ